MKYKRSQRPRGALRLPLQGAPLGSPTPLPGLRSDRARGARCYVDDALLVVLVLPLAVGGAVRVHAMRALKARGPKFRGGGSVFRNTSAGGEWWKSDPRQELGCCATRQGTKEVSWWRSAIHKRHLGLIAELRAADSRGRRAVLQAASRGGFIAHQGGTSVRQEGTRRRSASSSGPQWADVCVLQAGKAGAGSSHVRGTEQQDRRKTTGARHITRYK